MLDHWLQRHAVRLLSISSALVSLAILLSLLYILGCAKTNETPPAATTSTTAPASITTTVQIPDGGTLFEAPVEEDRTLESAKAAVEDHTEINAATAARDADQAALKKLTDSGVSSGTEFDEARLKITVDEAQIQLARFKQKQLQLKYQALLAQSSPPAQTPILCKATIMLIPDSDVAAPQNSPDAHPAAPQIIAGQSATKLLTPAEIPFKNAQVLSRPYLLLNNSQTGDIEVGQTVDLPTDYKKTGPAADAWTPVTTPFFSGISLKLTANLAADQKTVAMDLTLRLTSLAGIHFQHAPAVPIDQDFQIAVPISQNNSMQSNFNAALGNPTVIVGPLYTGPDNFLDPPATHPAPTAPAAGPPRRIVLILTATLPKPGQKIPPAATLP